MWREEYKEVRTRIFDFESHFPNPQEAVQKLFDANRRQNAQYGAGTKVNKLIPIGNKDLLRSFEATRVANPHLKVEFGFHGTSYRNHKSIKSKGLMVPATSLQVVNGSAYGRGVYVSKCPVYSTSYVRDRSKMFVVAILTGDHNVSRNGNILVAKDSRFVVPYYVMHYTGPEPSKSYGSHLVHSPIVQYLSWYFLAALAFLAGVTVAYLLTGTLMTFSWFIHWGRLPSMGFFEFVFSGGTSSILSWVSYLHSFAYASLRLFIYCMVWKGLKFFVLNILYYAFFYVLVPPFKLLWLGLSYIPVVSTIIGILAFCTNAAVNLTFAIFLSFEFYVAISMICFAALTIVLLRKAKREYDSRSASNCKSIYSPSQLNKKLI